MIIGIKEKEEAYLATSFNHYDYTGLTKDDLLAADNSPFLWHPSFLNGVMAIDGTPRFKWIINAIEFPEFILTKESLYHQFLIPLKKKLIQLGLEEDHSYHQDYIFFMHQGTLAQIDPFGVIEIGSEAVMTFAQNGITINSLDFYAKKSPLEKLDNIMQAHVSYVHRQTIPFSYVSSTNPKNLHLHEQIIKK